jgi:hypothetical protein
MEDSRAVMDYITRYREQGRGWWMPGKDLE